MSSSSDTQTELLEAIRELTASRERIPTMSEFVSSTEWRYMDVEQTFTDWQAAIEAAGIDFEASLETELQHVAQHTGHRPTPADMDEYGRYASGMYQSVFASWEDAIAAADLTKMDTAETPTPTDTPDQSESTSNTSAPVTVTDTENGILESIVSEFESDESH